MVSSVAYSPYYSYLGQLQGAPATTPAATGTTSAAATATAATAASTTAAQQEVSSLLSGGAGYAPEVLSLLQEDGSGSFSPIASLLGGTGANDAATSMYANLFASSTAASLTQAQNDATPPASVTSPVQNLLTAQTQASLAYNQTNRQNAQSVINGNSYEADGVTPLVA